MRISLSFIAEQELKMPISYNYGIQSLIYGHIDDELAMFLHDKGYVLGKRRFKLFTFSRIQGKIIFLKREKMFVIKPPFKIIIASPIHEFIESLAENLVKSGKVQFFEQPAFLELINVYSEPQFDTNVLAVMLSPVTMYSTLPTPDGKRKTYYYTPFENEFSLLLKENLKKKYKVLHKAEPNDLEFSIEPIGVNKNHEKIIDYKGTVIKGWMGKYKFKGSPELIKLAYDAGLGAKNSQGFGCFEIIK